MKPVEANCFCEPEILNQNVINIHQFIKGPHRKTNNHFHFLPEFSPHLTCMLLDCERTCQLHTEKTPDLGMEPTTSWLSHCTAVSPLRTPISSKFYTFCILVTASRFFMAPPWSEHTSLFPFILPLRDLTEPDLPLEVIQRSMVPRPH